MRVGAYDDMPSKSRLNDKQRIFCREYLVDLHATAAAIRAGYGKKNASIIASRLVKKSHVQAYIRKLMKQREERLQVTAERVALELARIAFGDMRNVMTWGPDGVHLKPSSELSEDDAAAIAEVSESLTEGSANRKVKKHDKVKALELLGKHLGMFTERHKLETDTPKEVVIFFPTPEPETKERLIDGGATGDPA